MVLPGLRQIEVEFFRMLNRVVEPRIRAGFGSPCLTPGGFIVLETRGRKTGRRSRIPLAATRIRDHVVVGTFRGGRSQWVKNLSANPQTRFWLAGRPRRANAFVIHPTNRAHAPRDLPAALRWVVTFLRPYTHAGWAFAVLAPEASRPSPRRRRPSGGSRWRRSGSSRSSSC
jgi:deazaflavin-dependent oxidoreductase (nitroreductase family)